jgi:hypothetical protein
LQGPPSNIAMHQTRHRNVVIVTLDYLRAGDGKRCLNPTFCQLYALEGRPSVLPAGAAAAGLAAAGVLRDPHRAVAAGAAPLQPAVPLVYGPQPRRRDLAPDHIDNKT